MNTLWFVTVVLLLVFSQGFVYSKYVPKVLKLERSFSVKNAAPGEMVTLNISVTNKGFLPLTWIHIEESVPVELKLKNDNIRRHFNTAEYIHNIVISLLPLQRVNRRYNAEFTKRGYYELKQADINISDMFGDNSHAYTILSSASIVIYPRLIDMSSSLLPSSSMQGDVSVNRWIIDDPTMMIGQRDYVRGDSFKSISWKRTAKERHLMVNKHDHTSDKKFMMLLNLDELGDIWSPKLGQAIERAIEVCAFVAESLIFQGIPAGFATNALYGGNRENSILEPSAGNNQMRELMDCLGRIQYYKKSEFADILEQVEKETGWGTEYIIVVPCIREEFIVQLCEIHKGRITIITMEACDIKHLPDNLSVFVHQEAGETNAAV